MPDVMATGRLAGRFGTTQAVALELAVVAVVTVPYLPLAWGAVIGAGAILLLAGGLFRFGGRWGYETVTAWLRLVRRRAGARAARTGPYRGDLPILAPRLSIHAARQRTGAIGVGEDELGWFAAIALTPVDGLSRGHGATLRLDWLARLVADASLAASTLQIVVRHTPLPSAGLEPASACARSYQALREALGVPAQRDVWIAVRLGLRDGAQAAAQRGGDLAGVHRALASALGRISAGLAAADLDHEVLDAAGLHRSLTVACGQYPASLSSGSASPTREAWSAWRGHRAVHVCFAVKSWPAAAPPHLFTELARLPQALSVSTAMVFSGTAPVAGQRIVPVRTLVRVAAAPEVVGSCVRELRSTARRLGVPLVRLDGEQAAGVYATAPTGAAIGLAPW